MSSGPCDRAFVTTDRLVEATILAEKIARKHPGQSGGQCAEQAVRVVFGEWLLDWSALTKPACLPLYFQLVGKIEGRLDLHRCSRQKMVAPTPPLPGHSPIPLPMRAVLMAHAGIAHARMAQAA